jgi:hypothetical protein
VANQTEKSSNFYKYDDQNRIIQWIQIVRDEDAESNVFLNVYTYTDSGQLDLVVEKEGALRYNLGTRLMDTIYKNTVIKKSTYVSGRLSTVVTYTNNNLDQTVESSVYKYKYKGDRLDEVDLFIGEEKKAIYSMKVLKTE